MGKLAIDMRPESHTRPWTDAGRDLGGGSARFQNVSHVPEDLQRLSRRVPTLSEGLHLRRSRAVDGPLGVSRHTHVIWLL